MSGVWDLFGPLPMTLVRAGKASKKIWRASEALLIALEGMVAGCNSFSTAALVFIEASADSGTVLSKIYLPLSRAAGVWHRLQMGNTFFVWEKTIFLKFLKFFESFRKKIWKNILNKILSKKIWKRNKSFWKKIEEKIPKNNKIKNNLKRYQRKIKKIKKKTVLQKILFKRFVSKFFSKKLFF